jgi:hypothetical protein
MLHAALEKEIRAKRSTGKNANIPQQGVETRLLPTDREHE